MPGIMRFYECNFWPCINIINIDTSTIAFTHETFMRLAV